jgi:hypothetical protein
VHRHRRRLWRGKRMASNFCRLRCEMVKFAQRIGNQ